jgi:uroporphyrinogen decarboxylase
MMENRLLLDALEGCNHAGRPPIWLMRQAGRYLPEYRALRHHYPLLAMFHEPDLIAHITMLPVERLGVDAAILYSDILIILDALGIFWNVRAGVGPVIDPVVQTFEQVAALRARPVAEALRFVFEGIAQARKALKVPLIGFCGAPFTVACYMIEGKTSRDFHAAKRWMYRSPSEFHSLLSLLTDLSVDYLNGQIDAGVDAVQIFDSWAHALSPRCYRQFCLPYLHRMVQAIAPRKIPIILYSRGSLSFAGLLAECSPAAIGLDWQCELSALRQQLPPGLTLQGNLDPCALFAAENELAAEIDRVLHPMQKDPSFIFNLGHGVLPETPIRAVEQLVDRVQSSV